MKIKSSSGFIVALSYCLLLMIPTSAQTQSDKNTSNGTGGCEQFKGQVIKPDPQTDYKLRITKPDETIDPKAVINPCEKKSLVIIRPLRNDPLRPKTGGLKTPEPKTPFTVTGRLKPLTELVPSSESLSKARQAQEQMERK